MEKRRIRVMEKSPRKHLTVSTSDYTRVVQTLPWRLKLEKKKQNKILWAGVTFRVLKKKSIPQKARVSHSLTGLRRRIKFLITTAGCNGVSVVQMQHCNNIKIENKIPKIIK